MLAIGPLGLMAGGPEDHFTDSRELYVLVEGDEWAHVEALDPDAGYWGLWPPTAVRVPRVDAAIIPLLL